MTIVRFAPSPTGYLHIGGARTALFNWLYARRHGGKLRLRIEDTDRARSTEDAIAKIFDGLKWLGLDWDGDAVFQFSRMQRHAEVARSLVGTGLAYHCYASTEELAEMREAAKAAGKSMRYDGRWRDRDPKEAPAGVKPVVRLKAPRDGETVLDDMVKGEIRVANAELDDMVLLRADGTPTYMLSAVVDDHDMEITHVIRGDDHQTNTFRQQQLFHALGWQPPRYGHIPLIHGPDGAKLSKRHGALGIEAYREMGFLPEAMFNYLLRLGWAHGDEEIISREQAIAWFDIDAVGKSPARFDMAKLTSLNAHYIREADDARLLALILPLIAKIPGTTIDDAARQRLRRGMKDLKPRAKTLVQLAEAATIYCRTRPISPDAAAAKLLDAQGRSRLARLKPILGQMEGWSAAGLEAAARGFAEDEKLKLGDVAAPLRAALTGAAVSPGIFEVAEILGRDETLARVADATT